MKMKKIIIILILPVAIIVATLLFAWKTGWLENIAYEDTLNKITQESIRLSVGGSYSARGVNEHSNIILRKNMDRTLQIRFKQVSPEYKKLLFKLKGFTQFLLDEKLINISFQGANSNTNIECEAEDNNTINCSFTPKNVGEDEVTISLDTTDVAYKFLTITKDPTFFLIPLGISEKNVTFKDKPWLKTDNAQVIPPYAIGEDNHTYSNLTILRKPDLPGTLKYEFTSQEKEFESAYMEIHPIAEGLLSSKYPEEIIEDFIFPSTIVRLNDVLHNRPEELDNGTDSIVRYPKIRTQPYIIQKEQYIQTETFTGIRYTLDYTPPRSPSEHPTYVFQGITNNEKYFILFRYAKLHSPNLERILEEGKQAVGIGKCDDFNYRTFLEVSEEKNFSPSINELDDFVKSISLSY